MSKGKLVLQEIQSPVEGMQVIYGGVPFDYHDGVLVLCKITSVRRISCGIAALDSTPLPYFTIPISELKQIVVEYRDYKTFNKITKMKGESSDAYKYILPLHPDDLKWAIEHIGEEVEFIEHQGFAELTLLQQAKLIHPTPVIYTEEEARNIAQESFKQGLRFAHGVESNESGFRFNTIWNEHKKK